jgi:hypothetical protein
VNIDLTTVLVTERQSTLRHEAARRRLVRRPRRARLRNPGRAADR